MGPVILVVDDDDDLRDTMSLVVEGAGYKAVQMSRAADVIAYASVSPAPAAILLDLMMPGMTGAELRERLRAIPATAGTPIVVVTAFRDKRHLPTDVAGVLFKPFSADDLIAEVERVVRLVN
ncbi:MAG: two-component system response regulator [Myxococcota bacterium]